ncbi:putative FAD-dependent oxygenase [Poronia punctata]|nr:putative FAD-dependent oxygenase [Poronia punctata]
MHPCRFWVAVLTGCAAACRGPPANCKSPNKLLRVLRSSLSHNAAVYLPGSDGFDSVITRWSELKTPAADIVVVPATEDDVAYTVYQAHECGLPILAFNGVHGASTTLGRMDRGIAISLSQLSTVTVAQDGKTVIIRGGASSKAVTDALWAAGKQTVTGTCECVSYLGPALGGGHGWLQGHHGLIADQIISMDVVLANGVQRTIDPSSELWWAMKGAGHNFGIVTSVTAKVYDIEARDWATETLVFSGSKVEAVYEAANRYLANLPPDVINWSYWLNMPDVDPDKPIILFYIIQEGVSAVDPVYVDPFRAIGPISAEAQKGTYRDLAAWTGIALDSPPCQKAGFANPRFPIYLPEYNVAAQKEAYDAFAATVGGPDSPYSNSIFMFEGYPQQGVREVDSKSTAFAFRNDSLLVSPLLTYAPVGKAFDDHTEQIGNHLRDILFRRSGHKDLHAYVNYAYGNEKSENWYGAEEWRRGRLRGLKDKYDREGRFSFFGPIE